MLCLLYHRLFERACPRTLVVSIETLTLKDGDYFPVDTELLSLPLRMRGWKGMPLSSLQVAMPRGHHMHKHSVKCTYCLQVPEGCSSKKQWSQTRRAFIQAVPSASALPGSSPQVYSSFLNTLLQVSSSETSSLLPPSRPAQPLPTALC